MAQLTAILQDSAYKGKSYADRLPSLFAEFAGVLFGIFNGFFLLSKTLIKETKQIGSPTGRKEIIYGRHSDAEPVTFETARKKVEEGKDTAANAAAGAKTKVSEGVSELQKPLAQTTSAAYGSHYHAKNQAPEGYESATSETKTYGYSQPGTANDTSFSRGSEAVALGPGAVIPGRAGKPSTGETLSAAELDSELKKIPVQHVTTHKAKANYVNKPSGRTMR